MRQLFLKSIQTSYWDQLIKPRTRPLIKQSATPPNWLGRAAKAEKSASTIQTLIAPRTKTIPRKNKPKERSNPMKTTTKPSLAAAGLAFIATAAVFADDPQLQNRLDLQRNQAPSGRQTNTVAVYTGPRSQKET